MSSKLDYLKKYLSADEGKKKRRKRTGGAPRGANVRVVDEDMHDLPAVSEAQVQEKWQEWDMGGVSEDEPVVVGDDGRAVALTAPPTARRVPEDASPPRRQRHDSPDASPPRRQRGTSPPRRVRHDSPDASPPRRQRHDSPDASPPRRQRHDSPDASPPRRQRHDSPDASPPRRQRDASPPRRQRDASPPGRGRHDLHDASPPRRQRAASPPVRARRDSDASPPRRRPAETADASPSRKRARPASPGPAAAPKQGGLYSGQEFKAEQAQKRAERDRAMQAMSSSELGQGAQTVYRDRRGRKLEMLSSFMRSEMARQGTLTEQEERAQSYEWGTGAQQKAERTAAAEELAEIAAGPFAQYRDDAKLDSMLREQIRDGDPMAALMTKKRRSSRNDGSGGAAEPAQPVKPVYKGPPAPPTRYGAAIRPGYRWDGVDRSNGFEKRLLLRRSTAAVRADESFMSDVRDW